jgi:transposase-like protein
MPRARKYPEELIERGVRLALESGRPVAAVARDLGVGHEVLRKRVRQAEADGGLRPTGKPRRPRDAQIPASAATRRDQLGVEKPARHGDATRWLITRRRPAPPVTSANVRPG